MRRQHDDHFFPHHAALSIVHVVHLHNNNARSASDHILHSTAQRVDPAALGQQRRALCLPACWTSGLAQQLRRLNLTAASLLPTTQLDSSFHSVHRFAFY